MSGSEGRVDFEEAGVAEQVGAIVSRRWLRWAAAAKTRSLSLSS